ncbi:hypothetical protein ACHAW6_001261, partial [Cyclotella cf. meneghiniana]
AEDGTTPPWEDTPHPDRPLTQDPTEDTADPTVLTLADADNGFQNLGRYSLLWEVRHRWPGGARFAYNMYRHECRLLLRGPIGTAPSIILSREGRDCWLAPLVDKWVLGIERLSAVALRFPHSAYAGLVSCLSAEWDYLCRTVPDVGPFLVPIKDALRTHFLPAILGRTDPIDDDLCRLLSLGVKQGGLAIHNPVEGADALLRCSRAATETLVHSLLTNQPLGLDNTATVSASPAPPTVESDEAFRSALLARAIPKVKKQMERQAATGAWLTTIPDRFGGTELSKTEWHDNVSIRYGWRPLALPDRCDGCGEGFTVEHGLNCKKGGLVSIRHDDVRDEWAHLCSLSLSSSRVTVEPTIFYGGGVTASQRSEHPTQGVNHLGDEARGDVLAHGFWQRARGTIFDIRLCDTDARSYGNTESSKILERAATEKKRKYEAACLERRRDFTPLVYSVDGLASKDTRAAEKRLACLLSKKWSRAYSEMVGFIRVRMSLAIARSITLLLRGDRSHSPQRRAPTDG